MCRLWSELPPNRQRREVGAAEAAAPAAKSARASSKQRPQRNHSVASGGPRRPAPTRHKQPHGEQETTGRTKGEPQNKQLKPNPRGSQRKHDHPKGEPTKTWQPQGRVHTGETKASKVARPSKWNNSYSWYTEVAPQPTNFAPKQCQHLIRHNKTVPRRQKLSRFRDGHIPKQHDQTCRIRCNCPKCKRWKGK